MRAHKDYSVQQQCRMARRRDGLMANFRMGSTICMLVLTEVALPSAEFELASAILRLAQVGLACFGVVSTKRGQN